MSRHRANRGRLAAGRALVDVEKGAHVEEALGNYAPEDDRDRRLAWFLALGTLRRRGHVDAALRPHLRRPLGGLDAEVRSALRIGTFEKLFGRTLPHAVVHQSVELVKGLGRKSASGFVNAIMRKVEPIEDMERPDALDHPPWLVARWDSRYGEEATAAWCESNSEPAPLVLVENRAGAFDALRAEGEELEAAVIDGRELPGVALLRNASAQVMELPGFESGGFWVQDAAAVAVADLVEAKPGQRVLDACSAPGGKTFRLISQGAEVVSVDLSDDRLAMLRGSGERLGRKVTTRAWDWSHGPIEGEELFDAVLVDAPCTGLGTVRRHPDIRWRRQLIDVLKIPPRQLAILESASAHVKPGGVLVYAVCSPEPEEGEGVVNAFLAAHPDFTRTASLLTAPPQNSEDAHYAARMVRR